MGSDVWQNYTHLRPGVLLAMSAITVDPSTASTSLTAAGLTDLAQSIKEWGRELGFQQVGISGLDLAEHEQHLERWLEAGYHGEMDYMAAHGSKRSHPDELVPGTLRVVSLRMDYLPGDTQMAQLLGQPEKAYVSRYALGRDYHKLIRKRVQQLAERIQQAIGPFGFRAFVDSAPVLEKAIAEQAGLGWIGKNTLVLNRKAGSYFFLSELFVDLPLPVDAPHATEHCGRCTACLDVCPTNAFVGPYVLDARKCISYLTIELKTSIPEELRSLIGNRVFGCDDCQIVCPWNRFARPTDQTDFKPRHGLDNAELTTLFLWDETTFLSNTEGSPLRRAGYERWLRNLAVGLGNAPSTIPVIEALKARREHTSEMVREHVEWALRQHETKTAARIL
ncbi:tRNA epoxyqueuosine(34) reductase QueG [Pseudomonas sp. KU26590]|nr:tRNA epoxyqueuosine(34) reductase QueG [Pseudomonas sp. KU26590]UZJ62922.1 tRNA epoxyqueuosine(34) reductase QueG [Pseudomonas sp. KU26590]